MCIDVVGCCTELYGVAVMLYGCCMDVVGVV